MSYHCSVLWLFVHAAASSQLSPLHTRLHLSNGISISVSISFLLLCSSKYLGGHGRNNLPHLGARVKKKKALVAWVTVRRVVTGFKLHVSCHDVRKRPTFRLRQVVRQSSDSRVPNCKRRAQGCKEAGSRLGQEQRSSPSHSSQIKTLYCSHEYCLSPNHLGKNVSEVFLHTIGVSESPWLFRSPPSH